MSPNRITSWLVVGVLALLAAMPARAREDYLEGFDLFAPPEDRLYDDGPEAAKGLFFTFDGVFWAITAPAQHFVGQDPNIYTRTATYDQGTTYQIEQSTLTTGFMQASIIEGDRFDFGWAGDENGIFFRITSLQPQTQRFDGSNVDVTFKDNSYSEVNTSTTGNPVAPPSGVTGPNSFSTSGTPPGTNGVLSQALLNGVYAPLPVLFKDLTCINQTNLWSSEAEYSRRFEPFHNGGVFELLLGLRYMEFNDKFSGIGYGSVLDAYSQQTTTAASPTNESPSIWVNEVDNHIFGPQVGGRWSKKIGRWSIATEGRFMAGWNRQNYHQDYLLFNNWTDGATPPYQTGGTNTGGTNGQLHSNFPSGGAVDTFVDEFSPVVESKFELRYQLTKAISAHVGADAMWIGGLGRAANTINYQVGNIGQDVMGFDLSNTNDSVFVTGVSVGIDLNR